MEKYISQCVCVVERHIAEWPLLAKDLQGGGRRCAATTIMSPTYGPTMIKAQRGARTGDDRHGHVSLGQVTACSSSSHARSRAISIPSINSLYLVSSP